MKKLFLLVSALALAIGSCSDDDPGNGLKGDTLNVPSKIITNAPSEGEVDRVMALGYWGEDDLLVASTQWDDGFSMKLPEVPSNMLVELPHFLLGMPGNVYENMSVSDPDALGAIIYFGAMNGPEHVGNFYLFHNKGQTTYRAVNYVYCDRNVRITGDYSYSTVSVNKYRVISDVTLKKGWNCLYQIVTETSGVSGNEAWVLTQTQYLSGYPSGAWWEYASL